MERVHNLMRQGVARGIFPGAVLLAARERKVGFFEAYGHSCLFTGTKMARNTVFDLASLTKPLATTLAIMKLMERGQIVLSQKIETILPEVAGTDIGRIRIEQLLAHTSGLPAHRPYYFRGRHLPVARRKAAIREMLRRERLIRASGRQVVYSDLGFMILEWGVEILAGKRLDRFIAEAVYGPLGLNDLFFNDLSVPCPRQPDRFAATEWCPWRKRLLKGAVHDDNAYVSGGIQGHAGLFGTAADLFCLLSELLAAFHGGSTASLFQEESLKIFWAPYKLTGRSLGFDRPSAAGPSCGRFFSENTVGHLGFTGTSFWIDLERRIILILLTNRVHPFRHNYKIKAFRPALHDAVMWEMLR